MNRALAGMVVALLLLAPAWAGDPSARSAAQARKAFEAKHGSVEDRKNRKKWKAFLPTFAKQTRGLLDEDR